jgi:hypothetical protein
MLRALTATTSGSSLSYVRTLYPITHFIRMVLCPVPVRRRRVLVKAGAHKKLRFFLTCFGSYKDSRPRRPDRS